MKFEALTVPNRQADDFAKSVGLVTYAPLILTAGAVVVWGVSLSNLNIRLMNDLGLASVLPPTFFVAAILLTTSFVLALRQSKLNKVVLFVNVACLIVLLYGTPAVIEEVPGNSVHWRHTGYTEFIERTGTLATKRDAYFNWPSFFILAAFMVEAAGLSSPIGLTPWMPVAFQFLYLAPLVLILRSATSDKRLVWLTVWFFYMAKWVSQDGFIPQALNYFLYLLILGLLMQWFSSGAGIEEKQGKWWKRFRFLARWNDLISQRFRASSATTLLSQPWQRASLLLIIIFLFLLSITSHFLTPMFILLSVGALTVLNRIAPRGLPIVMAIMLVTWVSFMTVAFLAGHLDFVVGDVGNVNDIVSVNTASRLRGSPEHILIVYLRSAMSLAVWALAVLGFAYRWRQRFNDVTFGILFILPFFLLGIHSYGGEMLLRVYIVALPFAIFFLASLFATPFGTKSSWLRTVLLGLVSLLLLTGFIFARYGNERMDFFTRQEVDAVNHLYAMAKPGDQLVAVSLDMPWRHRDIEKYRPYILAGRARDLDMEAIIDVMRRKDDSESFMILTRSQQAYAELYSGWDSGVWDRFEQALLESDKFELVFTNEDASIFILAPSENQ